MLKIEADKAIRSEARAFEKALPASQRKELGQFFTGMPLGRVLAALAVDAETQCILDPMAGSGDLLDAASETAIVRGTRLLRLDAIEVDNATAALCEKRLRRVAVGTEYTPCTSCGDVFLPATHEKLPDTGYDLVITNPPYVRYQVLNGRVAKIRSGLSNIVEQCLSGAAQEVWGALTDGYSGLADLSVPSWLLSALLVKPEGTLALVVPATWRSRAYADVIRYLMLRSFRLELVVEDTQQGWFSDALVRTHLIIARRLSDAEVAEPLSARQNWPGAQWVQVAPEAGCPESLLGGAFPGRQPEEDFAAWCRTAGRPDVRGIRPRVFSLEEEWTALRAQAGTRPWMKSLERAGTAVSTTVQSYPSVVSVPEALRDLLPPSFDWHALRPLNAVGIHAGQGLRTGCNRFFYVKLIGDENDVMRIETDPIFGGGRVMPIPASALIPVMHRQADLEAWRNGMLPTTRVLVLRDIVLPEDMDKVREYAELQFLHTDQLPAVMPDELAAHVREAGETPVGNGTQEKRVQELSAVRTNVRSGRGGTLPRFWYMLPDFKPRHLPQAFVPRIIHDVPQVYANSSPAILIDANFSTFWTEADEWTAAGLAVLLNSTWCRAVMEATGTPLGGGALKLEAVHLRTMPVPYLDPESIAKLNDAGDGPQDPQLCDRIVLYAVLGNKASAADIDAFAEHLNERRAALGAERQRGAA
ncbi:hypothetical protein J2T55_000084 [Methylohalomonas lacus]|uniref:site-specific DNA-methyltransferase (adenine-specific) n=1 Tax=Methylohalomonas lacus TaxID=398773 RepID=A0AAE3HJN0_9GAMM|nr:N-6 DNA methylase [Methylohalomonas lacus]MCS3902092.1 hypothetical protein [Methylohalomonas lacus]